MILSRILRQNLFKIEKTIWLKMKSSYFDFSENYQFIPQNKMQSSQWDHQCCTLFTALVH